MHCTVWPRQCSSVALWTSSSFLERPEDRINFECTDPMLPLTVKVWSNCVQGVGAGREHSISPSCASASSGPSCSDSPEFSSLADSSGFWPVSHMLSAHRISASPSPVCCLVIRTLSLLRQRSTPLHVTYLISFIHHDYSLYSEQCYFHTGLVLLHCTSCSSFIILR